MIGGNFVYEFDDSGNLKKSIGYGLLGDLLFENYQFDPCTKSDISPAVIGATGDQFIDKIQTIKSNNGTIVETKYYSGGNLIWNQKVTYNSNGDISSIIKEYASLRIHTTLIDILYADTTTLEYSSIDSERNWTVAKVHYKGFLPKQKHDYTVFRQITYDGEAIKSPLIEELSYINSSQLENTEATEFQNIGLGKYGTMSIPNFMAEKSNLELRRYTHTINLPENNIIFEYDNNDAYASIHINHNGPSSFDEIFKEYYPTYDVDLNNLLNEMYSTQLAQSGVYVLKWLPYDFLDISGHQAIVFKYYRYGIGSPIPVYCENYTIRLNEDQGFISILYSYQSNQSERFDSYFKEAIKSIKLF